MANYYWNPTVATTFNGVSVPNWATTFNGIPSIVTPTSTDNCYFTATSSLTCTISATASCLNLYFDNADNGGYGDYIGTLAGNYGINIYGSFAFSSGMTFSFIGNIFLKATSGTNTINTNGHTISSSFNIGYSAGTEIFNLLNNLVLASSNYLYVYYGTFNANGYSVSSGFIYLSGGTINLGSGTWNLLGASSNVFYNTGATIIAGFSTIKFTDTTNTALSFVGNSQTYNNIYFNRSVSTGSITFIGNNTFNDFKDDGTGTHSIILTGTTQIVSTFTVNNTSNLTTITNGTLSASSGIISCNYIKPTGNTATGGAHWIAHTANGCVDGGGNNGWLFAPVVYTVTATPTSFSYTPQTDGNYKTIKLLCSPVSYTLAGMKSAFKQIFVAVKAGFFYKIF